MLRGLVRMWPCAALTVALLLGAATPAAAEKRVALVVGNSAYQHVARLANPAKTPG